jgi:hypothetical protein
MWEEEGRDRKRKGNRGVGLTQVNLEHVVATSGYDISRGIQGHARKLTGIRARKNPEIPVSY